MVRVAYNKKICHDCMTSIIMILFSTVQMLLVVIHVTHFIYIIKFCFMLHFVVVEYIVVEINMYFKRICIAREFI